MLNENGERMLAYTERVTAIRPIEKADRLEQVYINGWACVCGIHEFHVGEIGVFFEIDSKLPEVPPFSKNAFIVSKHYRIKTQKIRGVYSQGLLMPLSAFEGDGEQPEWLRNIYYKLSKGEDVLHIDLTGALGVTYAVAADNERKASKVDKYKPMTQRHPEIFRHSWAKWMMKREWGKKVMFALFGKKRDNKLNFPTQFPYVTKSDEERCENLPIEFLRDKTPYRKTLKIDGTSTLFLLERQGKRHFEFWVCSRNRRILNEDQKTFHGTNVYWEMAKKYDIENKLKSILQLHPEWKYVAVQGETAGAGCQGNPHQLPDTRFYAFNFIDPEKGRWDSVEARDFLKRYDIPFVPIVEEEYILPDDFEEFKLSADGPIELEDAKGKREGYVYRSSQDPLRSFKNVSREYLLKHQQ